ncbi:MAG: alginate export family protein [Henriciella sp.]|nr:alginate export family protein [Henriciella sp.]
MTCGLGAFKTLCAATLFAAIAVLPASAEEPWRLDQAVRAPDWLTVQGETRARYESLEGQFRAGREGSDQLLALRSLLLVEADTGPVALGFELQDSRTYLGDAGTPLSSSIANPLDVLQLYTRFDAVPGLLGAGSSSTLKLGRQTVSIGSKRQIERVDFANVIKSYTGAHLISTSARGDELHGLYVVPTARFPNQRPDLDDNTLSGDEEQWERRNWGIHYRRADALGALVPGLWLEGFVYGLEERDSGDFATPDRSYVSPGFRVYRKPAIDQWDVDIEAALRHGTRYATSDPNDTQSLAVDASMLHAELGYTFDAPWQPRFALEYYYASGDDDPNDLNFDQHGRLFGARRSDLNNTSIHGPLTPANLNAPGFRIEVKPNKRWDARLYYHAAHLASETDSWVIAGLRDPTGQSGSFIGHTLDSRARYWVVPGNVRLELGASALIYGEFAKNVPDGPEGDGTLYGYAQVTVSF